MDPPPLFLWKGVVESQQGVQGGLVLLLGNQQGIRLSVGSESFCAKKH